jgi:hypothetical protein
MTREDDISDIIFILKNHPEIPDEDIADIDHRLYTILDALDNICKECRVNIEKEHKFHKDRGLCAECHCKAMDAANEEWKMTGEVIGRW